MPLKLLLDENLRFGAVWHAIAAHNRIAAYQLDVVRVGDDGAPPLGASDEAVIRWAAEQERILVSQDARTLERAVLELIKAGDTCPGVVLLRKGLTVMQTVELLLLIAHASESHEWQNAIHRLP